VPCNNKDVTIYAPEWMNNALDIISEHFKKSTFEIRKQDGKTEDKLIIEDKINLRELVAIARNEPQNTTGIINFSNYPQVEKRLIIYVSNN